MYTSFVNRGIYVFTAIEGYRKAFKRRKQLHWLPSPARKPKFPVPKFGI
jgi:hypothetical protein